MSDSAADFTRPAARLPRTLLAISTVLSSWLLMQVIHESGHVLAAIMTGGQIRKVVLVPWELSRTDLGQNPCPLIVCWAGPVFGAIAPVAMWLIARLLQHRGTFWLRFLAGFCLIANGSYIGVGAFTHDGDGGDLIRYGASNWTLILFGIITIPAGFMLWNGLGADFGLGLNARPITTRTALTSCLILITIAVIESMLWILDSVQNR